MLVAMGPGGLPGTRGLVARHGRRRLFGTGCDVRAGIWQRSDGSRAGVLWAPGVCEVYENETKILLHDMNYLYIRNYCVFWTIIYVHDYCTFQW
jgi:hypothetical protein